MKKKYEKPMILIENFSLSETIAAGCDVKVETQNSGQCGLEFGAQTIFLVDVQGCTKKYTVDDGSFNGLCYHNPTDSTNLFNS